MSGLKVVERDGQIIPEIVLASEEVQVRNIESIIQYVKESRKIIRELDERIIALRNIIMTQDGTINNMKAQMAALQQAFYAGGTGSNLWQ